jgi:hypothetical protein
MSRIGRPLVILAVVALVAVSAAQSALASQARAVKDGWLVLKVHSEMVDEDVLSGSNIDVDVKDGVVTLRGTVPSEAGRARALEVARKNDGVRSVVDRLTIAAPRAGDARDKADRAADRAPTRPSGPETEPRTKPSGPESERRMAAPTLRERPDARSMTAGSSRRSTPSTWPTGARFSTTATSTSTSSTMWSR